MTILRSSQNVTSSSRLSVAIVSGYLLFREAFVAVLRSQSDMQVLWEAGTFEEAAARLSREAPDVLIADLRSHARELEAVRELATRTGATSATRLVLLLGDETDALREPDFSTVLVTAGGVLRIHQPVATVLETLRTVGRGRPPPVAAAPDPRLARRRARSGEPLALLSSRERDVFWRLVRGEDNHAIGEQLGITLRTVETHRARVLKKLRLHSLAELLRWAARNGLPIE